MVVVASLASLAFVSFAASDVDASLSTVLELPHAIAVPVAPAITKMRATQLRFPSSFIVPPVRRMAPAWDIRRRL
jgi:hypothetical protein